MSITPFVEHFAYYWYTTLEKLFYVIFQYYAKLYIIYYVDYQNNLFMGISGHFRT